MTRKSIAIVAPVYEEAEALPHFMREVKAAVAGLDYDFRFLLVDDGSSPATVEVLAQLCREHADLGVIHLSRNFGQQAALTAGLDYADADAVIVMDSDLQHPPALLPQMIQLWSQGYDVVYTIRQAEPGQSLFKRWSSSAYYKALNLLSDYSIPAGTADFRLMSRAAVEALRQFREKARFLRGLVTCVGFSQVALHYTPAPRKHGTTKYSLNKMVRLGIDGVLAMSSVPLRVSLVLGFFVSMTAITYMIYVVIAWFVSGKAVRGWSSLIIAVLFLGGLQLSIFGVLGLYLAKIYEEVKQRPIYIVRRRGGALAEPAADEERRADQP